MKTFYTMSSFENLSEFISQQGIYKSCEFSILYDKEYHGNMPNKMNDLSKLCDYSVLYIHSYYFNKQIVDNIKHKIILIVGNDDYTFPYYHFWNYPVHYLSLDDKNIYVNENQSNQAEKYYNKSDFLTILESEKIVHCFAQNCVIKHTKITKIPIGIFFNDTRNLYNSYILNALQQEKLIKNIISFGEPIASRKQLCYGNFNFNINSSTFGYDRKDAFSKIPSDLIEYEINRLEKFESYRKMIKYAFIVSPHGNGLDCFRTWEAIYLGCIPIVKTSMIDDLYDNLPVLIVKDWSDITRELLEETLIWYKENVSLFCFEKLKLSYWIEKIYSYKNENL